MISVRDTQFPWPRSIVHWIHQETESPWCASKMVIRNPPEDGRGCLCAMRSGNEANSAPPTAAPATHFHLQRDSSMHHLTTGAEPFTPVSDTVWSTSPPVVHDVKAPLTATGSVAQDAGRQRLALTISETSALLGVSDKSVRRLIDRGLLRPSRALRHLRIPRWEIERFLRDSISESRRT